MAGEAFVTGSGIALPNAPVDISSIEAVLGRIEAQSAAARRRAFINNRGRRGERILGIVPESSRMLFGFLHFTVV